MLIVQEEKVGIGQELTTFPVQHKVQPTCFLFPTSGVLLVVEQSFSQNGSREDINCRTMGDFQFVLILLSSKGKESFCF